MWMSCGHCKTFARYCRRDDGRFVPSILVFPEMFIRLHQRARKCPTNMCGNQTATQIWKIPNHERDPAKRCCFPQIPRCHLPYGLKYPQARIHTSFLFATIKGLSQFTKVRWCAHLTAHDGSSFFVEAICAVQSCCTTISNSGWNFHKTAPIVSLNWFSESQGKRSLSFFRIFAMLFLMLFSRKVVYDDIIHCSFLECTTPPLLTASLLIVGTPHAGRMNVDANQGPKRFNLGEVVVVEMFVDQTQISLDGLPFIQSVLCGFETRNHTKVWMPCGHIPQNICGILRDSFVWNIVLPWLEKELKSQKMANHKNT